MQPKVVQSIMGHQHYSTTIVIYTHVSEIKYQEEIGKFGKAVEPEKGSNEEGMKEEPSSGIEYMFGKSLYWFMEQSANL